MDFHESRFQTDLAESTRFLQDPHLSFLQCHFQLAGLSNLLLMLLVASEKKMKLSETCQTQQKLAGSCDEGHGQHMTCRQGRKHPSPPRHGPMAMESQCKLTGIDSLKKRNITASLAEITFGLLQMFIIS